MKNKLRKAAKKASELLNLLSSVADSCDARTTLEAQAWSYCQMIEIFLTKLSYKVQALTDDSIIMNYIIMRPRKAYCSYIQAKFLFEQQDWSNCFQKFKATQTIYNSLAQTLPGTI